MNLFGVTLKRFGIDCKVYPVVISDGARRIA